MRKTLLAVLAPLLIAATPKPTLSEAQQQCPFVRMSESIKPYLIPDLFLGGLTTEQNDAFFQEAVELSDKCARMTGIPEPRRSLYFKYVATRLARAPLMTELEKLRLPLDAIHDALDIGPARTNAEIAQLGDLEKGAILFKLMDRQFPIETLRGPQWSLIGGYAIATAQMHRTEAELMAVPVLTR